MANARAVIDVDINTSPAAAGLRDLQRQINGFTSALNKANTEQGLAAKGIGRQLSDLVNSSKFFTAETVRMETSAAQLDKTLKKGQVSMGQFFSARFRKDGLAAAQVMSLAHTRASALQTQFVQVGAAAGGMREALAIRPMQAFNSAAVVSAQKLAIHRAMLQQATTSMINFGKNTQWAGRQLMVGFTIPLTIFGGTAAKVFKELEAEAINFKKVYGDIFTTDEETESALNAVKELSSEFTKYGIAVKDTMALAGVAAQSGLRNAELMAATTQATRLATLGQMEQADAMKTIISLQTAFKSSNDELAESVDFLNIIENQTVLSLQDVAGAIPRVAPVIQGLGGDVKDLAVLLVAMKEGGVSAGEGANALKSSLGRLITPTKRAKEMAAGFGIDLQRIVEENRGQVVPMIQELAQAMSSLGGLEQQQLLSTLFGKFQYARIGALFKSLTDDSSQAARAINLISMEASQLAAIADKELAVVEEATSTKMVAAMERLKVAIAPIGEMFTKMATPIINFLASIAEKFNNLPDFAKNFLGLATVITGLVIPAGTMFLGLLMNLVGTLVKFGHIVGIAFKGFVTGGFKGAFDNVSQALKYMSLQEIDAANAAKQLSGSTEAVNAALLESVGMAKNSTTAIMGLAGAYDVLAQNMREAAAIGGLPMAGPGGAMMAAGRKPGSMLYRPLPIVARNKGGSIPYMSKGNTVPGTGNKDTVPAMLTPGEFVVNKQATQENIGLLHAINNGDVQYRNKGGGIAKAGRGYYGRRVPNPYSLAGQQAVARLEEFESSRSTIAQLFGLPIGGVSRSRSAFSAPRTQVASARRSGDIFDAITQRGTKSSRLLRVAESLGISRDEMGLKQVGNFVLAMSKSSNVRMANGTLSKRSLISELNNPEVYSPISEQLTKYFGRTIDRPLFDQIYRQEIAKLPENGITNKLFEKASRNALRIYLDQSGFDRSSRKSFLRDVLSPDSVRASLTKDRVREALRARGITPDERGGDIKAVINGEEFNFSNLTGRTFDRLGRPKGIIRYDDLNVPEGLERVHANKGGMIPGVQYLRGGGIAALLQNISRQRSRISGLRSIKNIGTRAARSDRQRYEDVNFARYSRLFGTGQRGEGYRQAQEQGYITAQEKEALTGRVVAHAIGGRFKRRFAGRKTFGGYPTSSIPSLERMGIRLSGRYFPSRADQDFQLLPSAGVSVPKGFNSQIAKGKGTIDSLGRLGPEHMVFLMENLMQRNVPAPLARSVLTRAAVGLKRNLRGFDGRIDESIFYRELAKAENKALIRYEEDFMKLGIRANKGGMIPGFARGGALMSRAAQLKAIREADGFGILGGNVEDKSLRSILRLGFNDTRTDSPSDFVKAMFGRWETVPTRISPKENTTMLLKGKKPKYAPVSQEDYLADMIMSGNKFSDVVDAFKPITIGRMRGRDETRVFDGHTRIHSQLVKGLIERKLGLNTSGMSREELVDAIRTVRAMSLDGKITNTDVMRATSGQKVLVRRASQREVDKLFDHPLRRQPMGSMMNRQGRTLIPGIHDAEIESIVNAARKANFYGVGKDTESLMKSMGFVSLGGGARYRYEPSSDFRNRSSFVNNMGRRIVDDLIDRRQILPLRRNMGGIIPQLAQGGPIALLRSYMAGNFDIMRNAATRRSVMSLATPTRGTFYRGTQIGSGALPKYLEKELLQAEKTGDYSKLIGRTFRMRSSDWSTNESTASRFIQMNRAKEKQDFLNYEKNLTTRQLKDAEEYVSRVESGRMGYVNQGLLASSREKIPMLRKDLERINKELADLGELSPLLIKASGTIKGVEASKLIPDATYLGRAINEDNIISSGGMFQIKSASKGRLEVVPAQQRNLGGEIFESGSKTIVPGVGNTDTVPAALTPGEFVINKQATQKNKPLLEAINSGKAVELNEGGYLGGSSMYDPRYRDGKSGSKTVDRVKKYKEYIDKIKRVKATTSFKDRNRKLIRIRPDDPESLLDYIIPRQHRFVSVPVPTPVERKETITPENLDGKFVRGGFKGRQDKPVGSKWQYSAQPKTGIPYLDKLYDKGMVGYDLNPVPPTVLRDKYGRQISREEYERRERFKQILAFTSKSQYREIMRKNEMKRRKDYREEAKLEFGDAATEKRPPLVDPGKGASSRVGIGRGFKEMDRDRKDPQAPNPVLTKLPDTRTDVQKKKSFRVGAGETILLPNGETYTNTTRNTKYVTNPYYIKEPGSKWINPETGIPYDTGGRADYRKPRTFRDPTLSKTTNKANAEKLAWLGVPGFKNQSQYVNMTGEYSAFGFNRGGAVPITTTLFHRGNLENFSTEMPISRSMVGSSLGPALYADPRMNMVGQWGKQGDTIYQVNARKPFLDMNEGMFDSQAMKAIYPKWAANLKKETGFDIEKYLPYSSNKFVAKIRRLFRRDPKINIAQVQAHVATELASMIAERSGIARRSRDGIFIESKINEQFRKAVIDSGYGGGKVGNIHAIYDLNSIGIKRVESGPMLPPGFLSPTLKMNKGNMVPGSGNQDTVPAVLTPGEFVVNQKAAQENLPLLHAINSGQAQMLNIGGPVLGYDAKGNPVRNPAKAVALFDTKGLYAEKGQKRGSTVGTQRITDKQTFLNRLGTSRRVRNPEAYYERKSIPAQGQRAAARAESRRAAIQRGVVRFGAPIALAAASLTARSSAAGPGGAARQFIDTRTPKGFTGTQRPVVGDFNQKTVRSMQSAMARNGVRVNAAQANDLLRQGYKVGDVRKGSLPPGYTPSSRPAGNIRNIGAAPGMATSGGAAMAGQESGRRSLMSRMFRSNPDKTPNPMRAMGASMGLAGLGMGGMMYGQQMQAEAAQRGETSEIGGMLSQGGMLLSMASILPFMGKFGIAIGAVLAVLGPAALALKAWRESVDNASRKAAEFGSNIGGASDALNTMGELLGKSTPSQQLAQLNMGMGEEEQQKFVNEFSQVFETESGKKFIDDLQNSTSAERFQKLSSYIQNAIAAGMLDKSQAQSFAKGVASMIGDAGLGSKMSRVIQEQGVGAGSLADLAKEREREVAASSAIAAVKNKEEVSYQQSSQAIGSSLQVIQDFGNAQALAYEEFSEGRLSFEQYQQIVDESREAQAKYTQSLEDAMQKTSDFGGSMQALKQELAKIIGEEGVNTVEEGLVQSAEKNINKLFYGQEEPDWWKTLPFEVSKFAGSLGAPDLLNPEVYKEEYVQKKTKEVMPIVSSAIAAGMNEGIATDLGSQIISGKGNIAETFNSLVDELGAKAAFETAALVDQVARGELVSGISGPPAQEIAQREQATRIVAEFVSEGGDPVSFQAWLNAIPEEKQFTVLTKLEGMTPEQQQTFIADAARLSQVVGQVMKDRIQDLDIYKEALESGDSQRLVSAIESAAEAGIGEFQIEMALREVDDQGNPIDGPSRLRELEYSYKSIMELPEEVRLGLDIDLTSNEDLDKFGTIANQIKDLWDVISGLDPNLNLVAAIEYLTLDEKGNPLTADEAANRTIEMNKLYKDLEDKDPEIRREAAYQILLRYNNNDVELSKESMDDIYSRIKNFDDLDPQSKSAILSLQADVADIEIRQALIYEAYQNGEIPAIAAARQIEALSEEKAAKMAQQKVTASQATVVDYSSSSSGSSGGSQQKSIGEQLGDEVKNVNKTYKSLDKIINQNTNKFKSFIAGPFAPEFLQYLMDQGEEGQKILKGGIDKVIKEYNKFKKIKTTEAINQAMVAPFFRDQAVGQQLASSAARNQIISDFNLSTDEADYVMDQVPQEQLDVLQDLNKEKEKLERRQVKGIISKDEKERLKVVNQQIKSIETNITNAAKSAETISVSEKLQAAGDSLRDEFLQLGDLGNMISANIGPSTAMALQELGIPFKALNVQTKEGKKNVQELINIVENVLPVARGLSTAIGGLTELNTEMQDFNALANAGYTGEFATELRQLGVNAKFSSDQIQMAAKGLTLMKAMQRMSMSQTDKLSASLNGLAAAAQAQLQAYQRTSIKPLEDQLQGINDLISAKQREAEIEERGKRQYEDKIDSLEDEQEKIDERQEKLQETHDERIKALEKVEAINERIARQQRSQLDVASALSRGDIAGAAQAALQAKQDEAQRKVEETKNVIELQHEEEMKKIEDERKAVEEKIKLNREEIEKIDLRIRDIQDDITDLQDLAYQKQLDINDAKKEEERIQNRIYKIQLAQSILEAKRAVTAAAQSLDVEGVKLAQQEMNALLGIAGPDQAAQEAFFEPVGARGVVQNVYNEGSTKTPQEIVQAEMDKIGVGLETFRNFIVERFAEEGSADGFPEPIRQMIESAKNTNEAWTNPETGVEYSMGSILSLLGTEGMTGLLLDFYQKEFDVTVQDMGDELAAIQGKMASIGAIVDGIVQSFEAIKKKLDKKIASAKEAIAGINAAAAAAASAAAAAATAASAARSSRQEGFGIGGAKREFFGGMIKRAFGGMINYKGSREPAPGMMYGGKMKKYAYGSFVPGMGMTDRVPALLTPGEFVIRKSVASEYGPLLMALNSNVFPKMNNRTPMPKSSSRRENGIQYNYDIDVNVDGTDASPEQIAHTVMMTIKRAEDRHIKGVKVIG